MECLGMREGRPNPLTVLGDLSFRCLELRERYALSALVVEWHLIRHHLTIGAPFRRACSSVLGDGVFNSDGEMSK